MNLSIVTLQTLKALHFQTRPSVLSHTHSFPRTRVATRLTLSDHALNPKGKWHNRDRRASHVHRRRTASHRLRWGSALVLLRGNVGRFFYCKWTSHPLYMKIRLTADMTRLGETVWKDGIQENIASLLRTINQTSKYGVGKGTWG